MNKIDKFLRRLALKEREAIVRTVNLILDQKFHSLDIKKLKGVSNIFRVRKGRIRIMFGITIEGNVIILSIGYRDDTTYNL